jgi:CRP/FNR family transcriptional regulator, cyclic AMP receptor protein
MSKRYDRQPEWKFRPPLTRFSSRGGAPWQTKQRRKILCGSWVNVCCFARSTKMRVIRWRRGCIIAPGQSMMVILKGVVRVSLPGPKGKMVILADLTAGEVLGEVALLDGKERSADATALTNCAVAVLERRDVIPFLENRPDTCLKLLEFMCARLRKSDERMSEIAFFELPARLAKVLLERIGGPTATGPASKLSLSQSELAGMINASRENVNRCLRDWQRHGIVSIDERWISVLQRDALSSIADHS